MTVNLADLELLDAVSRFGLEHENPALDPFRDSIRNRGDEAFVVYYLWQGGDLREISSFPATG